MEIRTDSKSPVQSGGIHISSRQVTLFYFMTSENALSARKPKAVNMDTKILGNITIKKGPEQVVPTETGFGGHFFVVVVVNVCV